MSLIPEALYPRAQKACAQAVLSWSEEAQFRQCGEELCELGAAINRMFRGRAVIEETADVILCLLQLRLMLGAGVDEMVERKLARLEGRLPTGAEHGSEPTRDLPAVQPPPGDPTHWATFVKDTALTVNGLIAERDEAKARANGLSDRLTRRENAHLAKLCEGDPEALRRQDINELEAIMSAAYYRCEGERDAALAEAAKLKSLLGLEEIPEGRPSYAPGGYGHELDRIADLLNDRDCAPEPDAEDQSVFAGILSIAETTRELVGIAFPKRPL